MLKYVICLLALAACGLPEKNHCTAAADCLGDEVCHAGTCQPMSQDACGPTRTACAADATCSDAEDALACVCKAGFTGDGQSCSDVDECAASTSTCATHATCTNTPGAFTCACSDGFTGDAAASYCVPARFQKIAAAGGFSCGLAADGGIYCWGNNAMGDLGDGTGFPRARPTQVGTTFDWLDVDAHTNVGCAIRRDHTMWCWGFGTNGQLGDGRRMDELSPTMVISDKPGIGWKAMALGRQHLCGLHDDGSLACWGRDATTNGELPVPVAVDDHTDWTAISVGTVRCGIRDAGHLYCWGRSSNGDLGLGDTALQTEPAQVGTDTWRSVAVGYYNTCGIRSDGALLCWGDNLLMTAALQYGHVPRQIGTATDWQQVSLSSGGVIGLRAGGNAYVWGANESGQLGVPLIREILEPTPISGPVTGWTDVNSGNTHGCGIAAGQAYCWGTVASGFLGEGSSTTLYGPTQIGADRWTAVAGGPGTCGVRADGALMCWGFDLDKGIGFGNTDPVWAPTRLGTDSWSAVSGSATQAGASSCAIRGGALYCWGDNASGQLGLGNTTTPQLAPQAVRAPADPAWTEVATSTHTCGITSAGKLWCWGENTRGELGTGATSAPVPAPTAPLPGTWRHVAVADAPYTGSMTCGIRTDHSLWCWGQNGTMAPDQLVPTQVGTELSWDTVSLASGGSSSLTGCAVKLNGTLWCWGDRGGVGSMDPPTPVQVGLATSWSSVAVGSEICGIQAPGTLWCWSNGGLLGDGAVVTYAQSLVDTPAPTQLGTASDWHAVATDSLNHGMSCATKTDGSLWCWGYDAAPVPGIVTTPVPVR